MANEEIYLFSRRVPLCSGFLFDQRLVVVYPMKL